MYERTLSRIPTAGIRLLRRPSAGLLFLAGVATFVRDGLVLLRSALAGDVHPPPALNRNIRQLEALSLRRLAVDLLTLHARLGRVPGAFGVPLVRIPVSYRLGKRPASV